MRSVEGTIGKCFRALKSLLRKMFCHAKRRGYAWKMLACVEVSIKDVLPCEAASDDMPGKRSLRAVKWDFLE